jgi:small subunit ribosomal protein S1
MKQLESDPWEGIEAKYPVGMRVKGRVTNITDYGAFVELEEGIEGLIHVSEMSWTKKNVHPGKIVSTSQEVEVEVLEVDPAKRRISLGLKQTTDNPWGLVRQSVTRRHQRRGRVKNITEFGLFIGLEGDVDGMVHLSDLDWNRPGEAGHRGLQQGRRGQGHRARRGQSRRSASRSASSSLAARLPRARLPVVSARAQR